MQSPTSGYRATWRFPFDVWSVALLLLGAALWLGGGALLWRYAGCSVAGPIFAGGLTLLSVAPFAGVWVRWRAVVHCKETSVGDGNRWLELADISRVERGPACLFLRTRGSWGHLRVPDAPALEDWLRAGLKPSVEWVPFVSWRNRYSVACLALAALAPVLPFLMLHGLYLVKFGVRGSVPVEGHETLWAKVNEASLPGPEGPRGRDVGLGSLRLELNPDQVSRAAMISGSGVRISFTDGSSATFLAEEEGAAARASASPDRFIQDVTSLLLPWPASTSDLDFYRQVYDSTPADYGLSLGYRQLFGLELALIWKSCDAADERGYLHARTAAADAIWFFGPGEHRRTTLHLLTPGGAWTAFCSGPDPATPFPLERFYTLVASARPRGADDAAFRSDARAQCRQAESRGDPGRALFWWLAATGPLLPKAPAEIARYCELLAASVRQPGAKMNRGELIWAVRYAGHVLDRTERKRLEDLLGSLLPQ